MRRAGGDREGSGRRSWRRGNDAWLKDLDDLHYDWASYTNYLYCYQTMLSCCSDDVFGP